MVSKRELKLKRLAHSSAWLERANKNYTELIYVVGRLALKLKFDLKFRLLESK